MSYCVGVMDLIICPLAMAACFVRELGAARSLALLAKVRLNFIPSLAALPFFIDATKKSSMGMIGPSV